MEWSDVRIFLAVAREGSLGAAARRLKLTQPTVGRRIKALEAAMGRVLFQRSNEGFVLTEEGELAMDHARRMEESALGLERQLSATQRELTGLLRVSCSDWFGSNVLAPILANFSREQPGIIVELLTESHFSSVARREADLLFRIVPFTEPEIVARKLLHVSYGLYIRSGDPAPRFGDGTGARLITMNEAFAGMPDVSWLQAQFPNATVAVRSNNRDVQAAACAAGAGVAVLPQSLACAFENLQRIDTDRHPPGRDTWVGYHRDLKRFPRLHALLDFIVENTASRRTNRS